MFELTRLYFIYKSMELKLRCVTRFQFTINRTQLTKSKLTDPVVRTAPSSMLLSSAGRLSPLEETEGTLPLPLSPLSQSFVQGVLTNVSES